MLLLGRRHSTIAVCALGLFVVFLFVVIDQGLLGSTKERPTRVVAVARRPVKSREVRTAMAPPPGRNVALPAAARQQMAAPVDSSMGGRFASALAAEAADGGQLQYQDPQPEQADEEDYVVRPFDPLRRDEPLVSGSQMVANNSSAINAASSGYQGEPYTQQAQAGYGADRRYVTNANLPTYPGTNYPATNYPATNYQAANYPSANYSGAAYPANMQSQVTQVAAQEPVGSGVAGGDGEAPFASPPPDEALPPPDPKPQEIKRPEPSAASEEEAKKKEEKKSDGKATGQNSDGKTPEQIGVPPPRPQPEFLRDTSVLLDPGQYQFETGISYTSNITDSVIGQVQPNQFLVANLRTTSRNLQMPLEFRVGLTDDMQGSISLPVGFANQTISIGNSKDSEDTWGIGDLNLGLTKVLREGKNGGPNLLGNLAMSAPTAETSFPAAQQAPGANLGNGFWILSTGITAVQSIDPIAVYCGLSYSNTFETNLPSGLELDPGNIISYRLGIGYAVNSRIALSSAFEGNYIGELRIEDRWIPGSAREPFSIRLAATIQSDQDKSTQSKLRRRKSTEPFVKFGLSEASPDVNFGIRWTY